MRTSRLVVWSVMLMSSAGSAGAQEWTRFRGPNGTGIVTAGSVPSSFTAADYNWRVSLPGSGHSSPVIWGRKVFLTSAEEDKGKRHILCLDAKTGATLWTKTFTFQPYNRHSYNSAASSTPVVDAERVYTTWTTHETFTVTALGHDGQEAWTKDLGGFPTQHGGAASPILCGDILVISKEPERADGGILGLNRRTGDIVWRIDRRNADAAPYATPIVRKGANGADELLIASTAHGITAADPKTGAIQWQTGKVFPQRIVGGLVEAGGHIIATCGEGGGFRAAVAVTPGPNSKVAYQLTKGTSYVPTPVSYNRLLFFWHDSGVVLCVRPETGETVWQERAGPGNFFGSPVCVNGKLYCMSAKGELVVIDASDRFSSIARIDLGEPSHATPAVSEGIMYLRTLSHLISVGGKSVTSKANK